MTAAKTGATVTSNGVNLIDKDNTRCVFLRMVEQITDTGRADTDEHFHEVRTRKY